MARRKPLVTAALVSGAVVAGGAALALNIGLLASPNTSRVGGIRAEDLVTSTPPTTTTQATVVTDEPPGHDDDD